jgi:hypothetical protein
MTVTARPRPRPRPVVPPRGSIPPGADYQCWVDAGGGTAAYDADRYMGLLKDRGILRPRRGLVETIEVVLQLVTEVTPQRLAEVLVDELGKDGWRIHDVVRCVRPGDPIGIGRPMTPEEERQVGIWEGR